MRWCSPLAASTCRGPPRGGLATPTSTSPGWSRSPGTEARPLASLRSAASAVAPTSWQSAPPSPSRRASTASTAELLFGSGDAAASHAATSWRSVTVGSALAARPTGSSPSARASSGLRPPTVRTLTTLAAVQRPNRGLSRHLRPSARGADLLVPLLWGLHRSPAPRPRPSFRPADLTGHCQQAASCAVSLHWFNGHLPLLAS